LLPSRLTHTPIDVLRYLGIVVDPTAPGEALASSTV
jgi:hypothetical protein